MIFRIAHLLPTISLIFILSTSGDAQWNLGVTLGGLAFHQGKVENPEIYPAKLDKKGKFVIIRGINISVSYRLNDYVGIKAVQSLVFHDSAGKFAGISHIGVQLHDDIVGMRWDDHHLSMSLGPFWYYRKGWLGIKGYRQHPEFNTLSKNGRWEHKFVWYGGFFRYDYRLDEVNNLSLDYLPGYPHVHAISAGVSRDY